MPTPGFNFNLIIILTTLFTGSLSQTACGSGWFGTDCKYKCWCRFNKCQSNGECVIGTPCVTGWFGPHCQYKNRVAFTRSNQSWIKDEAIGTCNPGTRTIIVDFDDSYHFSWLRIVYNRTALGTEAPGSVYFYFKDTLDNAVDCTFKRVFIVDPSTVDIHCNMSSRINQITLRGHDALRICELFLNGGRNLALKQLTNQSSVFTTGGFSFVSDLAVDGSSNSTFEMRTCSHTSHADNNPTWFLYFPKSIMIYRAVLFNRDALQDRLTGFILKVFDVNHMQVKYYKETGFTKLEYQVPFTIPKVVSTITVQAASVLTLCEVETYGEIICPRLKWGLDCLDDCTCQPSEQCSPITGKCDAGCPPGFYGRLCEKKCPKNCFNLTCFRDNGICDKCAEGYKGDYCDIGNVRGEMLTECLPNQYGFDCLLTCHSNCRKKSCKISAIELSDGIECSDRVCDNDGLCYACSDSARYGLNCTLECSKNCLFNSCDSKHGDCYPCKTGFYGNRCSQVCWDNCKDGCEAEDGLCSDCKTTFYGDNCSLSCPITCSEHTCQVTNGSCLDGCENGFFGENCSDICPQNCYDDICDLSNGSCYACDIGYYGVLCDLHCSEDCTRRECDIYSGLCSKDGYTGYHLEVFIPAAVILVALVIATVLLLRHTHERIHEETVCR